MSPVPQPRVARGCVHRHVRPVAYSVLRAMLNTAVVDELLQRNPCTVRGAGVSHAAERSVATIAQVDALAEAVPPRYRMLILLAAWSGARWGELVALTRESLDLERGVMTIDRQYVELRDGSLVLDTPKTAAGVRTVHIPPHLVPELHAHLDSWTTPAYCTSASTTCGTPATPSRRQQVPAPRN